MITRIRRYSFTRLRRLCAARGWRLERGYSALPYGMQTGYVLTVGGVSRRYHGLAGIAERLEDTR